MIRSILVPADGSSLSECAIPVACAIARRQQRASVEVVSVYAGPLDVLRGPGAPVRDPRYDADLAAGARSYVATLAERLAREAPDLSTCATALEGPPAPTIVTRVREAPHDLVVMTTHGRSGASRLWLGSVADRVVRQCPVPVLLLRDVSAATPSERDPMWSDVVVPVDTDGASELLVSEAMALAGAGATLHLLHVVVPLRLLPLPSSFALAAAEAPTQLPADILGASRDAAQQHLSQMADTLRATGLQVRTYVRIHPNPAEAILDLAYEVHARLIAMATHGRHGPGRLLLGSVTDKVIRGATVPVLVRAPAA